MKNFILQAAACFFTIASYAQYVGIGTTTPASALEIYGTGLGAQQRITDPASGNSLVLQAGAGESMKLTGYNYGAGTAQPLYLSVDGANTIMNPNGGNVGIGTVSPATRLTVSTPGAFGDYGIEHTNGTVRLSTYLNSTGGWIGTVSNHPLIFYTNDGGQQMTLTTAGQVGIGTALPTAGYLLDVAGPVKSIGTVSTHFVVQTTGGVNSWARLYMRTGTAPNYTQSWYMGTSRDFNGNQLYINDETNNHTRFSIQPNNGPFYMQGNVTQDLGSYGSPKAMVYLNGNGTIVRCFNGLTASTTGGCGFGSGRVFSEGSYYVNFPFDLNSRFISVTLENGCCNSQVVASYEIIASQLRITVMIGQTSLTDRPVMIIVY